MIRSTFGITKEPFFNHDHELMPQQQRIFEIIKAHAGHGGLSVITGIPGVGKTVLKKHIKQLDENGDTLVVSFSRTMETYNQILKQMGLSLGIESADKHLIRDIKMTVQAHARDRKTLYTLIDEAHLVDIETLRKLRLLFDEFPRHHNLVLFGQPELLHKLSEVVNTDIKSRITYSANILPLNDLDIEQYILKELDLAGLPQTCIDPASLELIIRSVTGNLRLCKNLCYASLLETCQNNQKVVSTKHVNSVLIQPHWRSHEELIEQQVA